MKGKRMPALIRCAAVALCSLACAANAVAGACSVSATPMAFRPYQPLTFAGKLNSTDGTADASVSVSCTGFAGGVNYTIALAPSSAGSSIVPRYLSHDGGGPGMAFNVYLDGAYTSVWGDGFTGAVIRGSIATGDSSKTHTVYGKLPSGQSSLRVGNYSGALTMRITYDP
jgi:spore coat protein U-like protein